MAELTNISLARGAPSLDIIDVDGLRGGTQVVDGDDVERRRAAREGDVGELGHGVKP